MFRGCLSKYFGDFPFTPSASSELKLKPMMVGVAQSHHFGAHPRILGDHRKIANWEIEAKFQLTYNPAYFGSNSNGDPS